ncbi:hypothetical protein LR68_03034 [Anoxybacillus sp. BCO1]|nr:hypothetical protein LR68_03034 [Anoxybacillus sp. BCO1]
MEYILLPENKKKIASYRKCHLVKINTINVTAKPSSFFLLTINTEKRKSAANAKRKNNRVVTVTPLSYAYNAKMGINANPVADNNTRLYPFHISPAPKSYIRPFLNEREHHFFLFTVNVKQNTAKYKRRSNDMSDCQMFIKKDRSHHRSRNRHDINEN